MGQGRWRRTLRAPRRTGDWWCERSASPSSSRCARNHSYDSITIDAFECCGSQPSSVRALVDVEVQRLAVEQPVVRRERREAERRASACIASRAGATGSDRTCEPVPAWSTSACSVSRIVPNSSAPMLYTDGPGAVAGAQARVGEIVGVHELVAVVAAAEHEHRRAVGDELEQDRHHPEPAVAEDRARADDRDVEPGRDRVVAQQLGPQLGPAVRLERPARRVLGRPGCARGCRRPRSTTCARPWRRRASRARDEHVRGAADVHRRRTARGPWPAAPARRCGTRRRRRRTRRAPRRGRARRRRRTRRRASVGAGRVQVEDADRVAAGERLLGQHGAEVAAAAGDQDRAGHQSWSAAREAPAHARPHAVEQTRPSARSRAPCAPGRCRRRSCPSARRARAAPARSGRSPARAPSSFSATTPATARDRAAGGARETVEPLGLERARAPSRRTSRERVRLGVGDPVRVARRGVGAPRRAARPARGCRCTPSTGVACPGPTSGKRPRRTAARNCVWRAGWNGP